MVAVVVLHWLSVMPHLQGARVHDVNVVDVVPGLWPLTWVGDVMALFFFAGGYANWTSLRAALERGETRFDFVVRRLRRLLLPTFGFFGVWLGVDLMLRVAGFGAISPLRHVTTGQTTPFGPLWFLAVYLVVVVLTPWTVAAHLRWRWAVPLAMVLGVVIADCVAFTLGSSVPLAANLALVWLVPHQLGYFYADGSLRALKPGWSAVMACAGLVALGLLTSLPVYPRSLIHPRWTVLGIDAPTLPLVAAAVWFVGLALLLRRPLERWLRRPRVWSTVSRANQLTMTVYLWHMTAYLLAVAVLSRLGLSVVFATHVTSDWWWARPVVIAMSSTVLVVVVAAPTGWLRRRRRRLVHR